jgi:hypothetical protein
MPARDCSNTFILDFELRDLAGVDSRKSKNVIVGERRIAMLVELAGDWIIALRAGPEWNFIHLDAKRTGSNGLRVPSM